jgi:hypothetical protein
MNMNHERHAKGKNDHFRGVTKMVLAFNADCPFSRHTGEGRYPAMKNPPRSGQSHDGVPLAWGIFNHLDSGLRRNDAAFPNELSGFNPIEFDGFGRAGR